MTHDIRVFIDFKTVQRKNWKTKNTKKTREKTENKSNCEYVLKNLTDENKKKNRENMSLTKVVYYVGDQDTPYLVKVITIKREIQLRP